MRYINKIGTDLENRGIECSQQYINSCWNNDEECYVNLSYDSSKLEDLRKLLVEEEVYCCYCMRKLYLDKEGEHNKNVTLEHIIPHQIKENEWQGTKEEYLKFGSLSSDKVNVCYEGKYDQPTKPITGLPHPHFVSYHNLVASCNGETCCCKELSFKIVSHNCCNNKRQERFVMPIFFYSDIEQRFGYDKEGKLEYPDEFDDLWFDKDHLNLSCDWLNGVRKFWYEFSQLNQYSEDSVEKAITDEKLRVEILEEVDPVNTMFQGFNNDRLWVILSEYSWFYNYYKNKEAA